MLFKVMWLVEYMKGVAGVDESRVDAHFVDPEMAINKKDAITYAFGIKAGWEWTPDGIYNHPESHIEPNKSCEYIMATPVLIPEGMESELPENAMYAETAEQAFDIYMEYDA